MNSSGFLPSINGASSPTFGNYSNDEYKDDFRSTGGSKFEMTIGKLSTLSYPEVNVNDTIKNRISTMENISVTQAEHNRTSQESLVNLSGDLHMTENNLKDLMQQMQNQFDQKLANLKKEYDHRFDLQSSENKRLQNHVSTLKADTNQLKRKLQATVEKVKKLSIELGMFDEIDEEASIISSGESLSRPHTTY